MVCELKSTGYNVVVVW